MPIRNEGKPVWISLQNVARLEAFGKFGESYNTILTRVLDTAEDRKIEQLAPGHPQDEKAEQNASG